MHQGVLPEDFVDTSVADESIANADIQAGNTRCAEELLEENVSLSAVVGGFSASDINDTSSATALAEEVTNETDTAAIATELTVPMAEDRDAEALMTSPNMSMEMTWRAQRVYLQGTSAQITIGDEDLAILETFLWDRKEKQWVGPTKTKDLNKYLAWSLQKSRGLGSGVRGYPYQTIAVSVRRVGKKKPTTLTHSGDGWWRGGRTKLKLWNLKKILRGEEIALKCVGQ